MSAMNQEAEVGGSFTQMSTLANRLYGTVSVTKPRIGVWGVSARELPQFTETTQIALLEIGTSYWIVL